MAALPTPTLPLITELSRSDLQNWLREQGLPSFRGDQIFRWLYHSRIRSFSEMQDLPAALRELLAKSFTFWSARVSRHQVSRDGTEKLLLQLADGEFTECVLMREGARRTICISTQVGCAMGCVFCASGLLGVKRNLSTGEILEQVLHLDRLLPPTEKITNVVLMGMGEPLANLKYVLPALAILQEPAGMGLGARRITISTVGLPEKMRELAQLGIPYNLAVSLHAPADEQRTTIVPVNRNIGLKAILAAADDYFQATGRRVTYEYCLLAGQNDDTSTAHQLADLLQSRNAHVNLIPMNPVAATGLQAPAQPRTHEFIQILESRGINATIRKRKGADIDAACGQLRLQVEQLQSIPQDD